MKKIIIETSKRTIEVTQYLKLNFVGEGDWKYICFLEDDMQCLTQVPEREVKDIRYAGSNETPKPVARLSVPMTPAGVEVDAEKLVIPSQPEKDKKIDLNALVKKQLKGTGK